MTGAADFKRDQIFLHVSGKTLETSGIRLEVHIGRFYTRGRIIRLDELGQTFVVGRFMRL